MPRIYLFTPALDTRLRLAWANKKTQRTLAIDALVAETNWPRHAFKYRAIALGLTAERRTVWTAEQDRKLSMQLGELPLTAIAAVMNRSLDSVRSRAHKLRLSSRITEGYSKADLKKLLGAPWHRIADWIERGWLGQPEAHGDSNGTRITDEALVAFIFTHMDEIDFRLADQDFLKGVFLDGKRKGVPRQSVPGLTRRSGEARHRSRSSARHLQNPLPFRGGDAGSGRSDAQLGQENARAGAAA